MSTADDAASSVEAELDGETHTVTCLPGQVVLEALECAGIAAPFSCRAGMCAACMCKLVEGDVELLSNNVLEQSDLDEGWILGCQDVPTTKLVRVKYTT